MKEFVPFEMERYQSTWEHEVELNLSESGVHPLTLSEISEIAGLELAELGGVELEYIQSNGGAELRAAIAAFHPGSAPSGVVVTSGSAEANFLAAWELLGPGDDLVFMEPNYFQIHGLAANFGASVQEWWLERDDDGAWQPDPDRLGDLITPRTRAVVVTSPNNPTGTRFSAEVVERIAEIAERHGIWVVADEVYRGAELDGNESLSFSGLCERLIVTGGLSKAYGAPGLRLGWAVTSAEMATRLWARKDYTTISVGAISEFIAARVLSAGTRPRLLERTRGILRQNWPVVEEWLSARDCFDWTAPDAGAIVFARYGLDIDSLELAERLRTSEAGLLVPGVHFRTPEYLRIGFGPPEPRLRDGLARLGRVVDSVGASATVEG